MNNIPLVSIIINNYNYGRFLSEAIESALNQTYFNTEVVVVDDGSTDNSHQIITGYKNRIIPVLKENGGQASAFNTGFAASKGDIICFLDADDIFLPEKVAKIVNVFGEHPDIGWCFHSQKVIDVKTGTLLKLTRESGTRECDLRAYLRKGKLSFLSPATSGTCFTRLLLQQILPMPMAKTLKTAADRYTKLMALALSKGFFLDEELTIQKIHGDNAYTAMSGKQKLRARGFTFSAYWMKANLPEFTKFTNKVFAKGLGIYWRNGGVEAEYTEVINNYLSNASLLERFEIGLRALYHRLKL